MGNTKIEFIEPNSIRWMNINDLPEEKWKPVKNFEQSYMVSTYGRIKSIDRIIKFSDGRVRRYKSCIKKIFRINKHYYVASFSKNLHTEMKDVHRLVAETFIPNPNNLPEVNHKDENSLNNHVDNLEWCTRKYNINYGTHTQKVIEHLKNCPTTSKPIVQKNLMGVIIKTYPSIREAARALGNIKKDANILKACKGVVQTSYGYKWEYL